MQYDIIFLSELKCQYTISYAGFHCIRSELIPNEMNRGGIAVMFKNWLWPCVYSVTRLKDQVWFKLRNTENLLYGAVYIAPRDSPFFDVNAFSIIQEQILANDSYAIVMGDLNARMNKLDVFNNVHLQVKYERNIDGLSNAHGQELTKLCLSNDIKPVNHLQYKGHNFGGNLTFRKGTNWISQLDWALVSCSALENVLGFDILQETQVMTDHAPLSLRLGNFSPSTAALEERALQLGSYAMPSSKPWRRQIAMHSVDSMAFQQKLPSPDFLWTFTNDTDKLCQEMSEVIYSTASLCPKNTTQNLYDQPYGNASVRWHKILQNNDSKQLWQSINWKGEFETPPDKLMCPTDESFCAFYEDLLKGQDVISFEPHTPKYIPVLDSDISPCEVDECIKKLKPNKAAGTDGVAPGLLKLLSDDWILIITFLFNLVFLNHYPLQWTVAKVFNIYKKGGRLEPTNYRGISVLVALAKLYDMVLARRFSLWFTPKYPQAGGQPGRGCEEQILCLRLLIDIAKKTKRTLFITFIDYQKAYDKVDRLKLLKFLDNKGCGSNFLKALKAFYSETIGKIGTAQFSAHSGVRQGAPTSCSLFTFFLEPTLDVINSCGDDGWLQNIHGLLLMDDTVILSSSREMMEVKLQQLKRCIDDIGMIINPSKSKFMCINSQNTSSFQLDGISIDHCMSYTYLGTPIINDSISEQVKLHLEQKVRHVFKFYSFLRKNSDAPYKVKRHVWDSALCSSIFYSCETWFTKDLRCTEKFYLQSLKALLGVRITTCNDLVLAETGECGAVAYVRKRQMNFLTKLMSRDSYKDSYIEWIIQEALNCHSSAGVVIQSILSQTTDPIIQNIGKIHNDIRTSLSSRRSIYLKLNPNLSVSRVYCCDLPEFKRIAFTRFRLSSHKLKLEIGRWSRIPAEQRMCLCGNVQNETHLLLNCPVTQQARDDLGIHAESMPELLQIDNVSLAELCYKIFEIPGL